MSAINGTLPDVSPPETTSKKAGAAERAAVGELLRTARARGEDPTGPDGLLKVITKTVLESALEEDLAEHLGFDKHQGPEDARTSATAPGPRRCSPTAAGMSRSRCRGTGPARPTRRSSASGSAG